MTERTLLVLTSNAREEDAVRALGLMVPGYDEVEAMTVERAAGGGLLGRIVSAVAVTDWALRMRDAPKALRAAAAVRL